MKSEDLQRKVLTLFYLIDRDVSVPEYGGIAFFKVIRAAALQAAFVVSEIHIVDAQLLMHPLKTIAVCQERLRKRLA